MYKENITMLYRAFSVFCTTHEMGILLMERMYLHVHV